ncbi:MAG: ArdC-like ssDNA-binding domain-containing protein [Brevibacterium aurantiacum]
MTTNTGFDPNQTRASDGKWVKERGSKPTSGGLQKPPAAEPERPVFTGYGSVQEKVDAMRAELESAVDRLADDDQWQNYLDTMSKFHRYSLNNQILTWLQRPDATRVAGFRKWKEMGRSVKKGEKGIAIFAPRTAPVKDDDGNPIRDDNGRKKTKVVGYTSATVFDVSQTEGEELPEPSAELSETPPDGFIDDMETAAAKAGYPVSYEPIGSDAKGYTSKAEKRIVVDSSLAPGERATTLAHELGHVFAGHLDDDEKRTYSTAHNGKRGEMEVEAESFSYVLARMNGMKTHAHSASTYVAGWQQHEPEAIRNVGERLTAAVKKAMTHPWRNISEDGA